MPLELGSSTWLRSTESQEFLSELELGVGDDYSLFIPTLSEHSPGVETEEK